MQEIEQRYAKLYKPMKSPSPDGKRGNKRNVPTSSPVKQIKIFFNNKKQKTSSIDDIEQIPHDDQFEYECTPRNDEKQYTSHSNQQYEEFKSSDSDLQLRKKICDLQR